MAGPESKDAGMTNDRPTREAAAAPIAAAASENGTLCLPGTLSGVPLASFSFHLGGRDWSIRAARDHAALLDVLDRFAEFPFGLLLWESGPALAAALTERASLVAGKRVLELGCGVGFPGIVARWLGAASVHQTDHIAEALQLARLNAGANGVHGIAHTLADWSRWNDAARYDVIIASDVLYDRAAHTAFAAVVERNLARGGRVLLTDPRRQDTPLYLAEAAAAGWHVTSESRTVPALLPGGADTLTIDVIELKRP